MIQPNFQVDTLLSFMIINLYWLAWVIDKSTAVNDEASRCLTSGYKQSEK